MTKCNLVTIPTMRDWLRAARERVRVLFTPGVSLVRRPMCGLRSFVARAAACGPTSGHGAGTWRSTTVCPVWREPQAPVSSSMARTCSPSKENR